MSAVLPCSSGNCVRKVGVCFETHLCLETWKHICRHSCLYAACVHYLCKHVCHYIQRVLSFLQSALACSHVLDCCHLERYCRATGKKMFILTPQYNPNMSEIIRIKCVSICQPQFIGPVCKNRFCCINDVILYVTTVTEGRLIYCLLMVHTVKNIRLSQV